MLYVIEDQGSREYMEDKHSIEFKIHEDYDYYAIFDGHGTDKVAEFAKTYLKTIIKEELSNNVDDPATALFHSIMKFNNMIPKEMGNEAGSTAVIILRKNKTYWVANIGDSRIIMNSNKLAVKISEDHKPDSPSELKRITDLGGKVISVYGVARVMGNLSLSRAFGDFYLHPYVTCMPDIYKVECNDTNKFFVAATDGVWDVLSNQEVIDVVLNNSGKPISTSMKELIQIARSRGSGDNITILIFMA